MGAKKMHAPLIYCSSAQSINVKKIFKVIIAKVFDLKPKIKEAHDATKDALIEFERNGDDNGDDGDNDDEDADKEEKQKKKKKKRKKKDEDEDDDDDDEDDASEDDSK